MTVSYGYTGSDVNAIIVTAGNTGCDAYTPTISTASAVTGLSTTTGDSVSPWSFPISPVIAIANFNPGKVTTTFK